jgi:hypothetical protein
LHCLLQSSTLRSWSTQLARCGRGADGLRSADLVTGGVTVHAFSVKYLLPIWFDVQVIER